MLPKGEAHREQKAYVLLNKKKGEALLGHVAFWTGTALDREVREAQEFRNEDSPTGKLLTDEWLADSEVVVFQLRKVEGLTRSFIKEQLQLSFEWGITDALITAAEWLRNPKSDYPQRVGRAVLKRFTPAQGTDEELLAWYDAHKDNLVFSAERKMFLSKP